MKILIVSDFYKPTINGVVASIINLKSGLELLGHEVRVLTLSPTKKSYYDEEEKVYYIGSLNAEKIYPEARLSMRSFGKEKKDILEWGPDIIHTQNEFSTFYIEKQIFKKTNIPNVHTYHTVYSDYTHYFFKNKKVGVTAAVACTKLLGRKVNCIIAPTNKIHTILSGYRVKCPVHTIPSGISLEKFLRKVSDEKISELKKKLNIPEEHMVLLSISRIGKEKNVDELIRCMKTLQGRQITLVIVGDGPEKKKIEKMVEKLGLSDTVVFAGMVSPKKVPMYYQMADLFVSASTSEAQGLTYIEALATGTPILCRKDDCLKGVLDEGNNGYLYRSEKEFIQKLDFYIQDEDKERMQKNAKQTVEKYSKESFVKSLENLYEMYIRKSMSAEKREISRLRYLKRRRRYS